MNGFVNPQSISDQRLAISNFRASLTDRIKSQAREIGFDLVGVAPAVRPDGAIHLRSWLERGFAGEMAYMNRHAAAREHPRHVLDGVRSIVMVAMNYRTTEPAPTVRVSSPTWMRA